METILQQHGEVPVDGLPVVDRRPLQHFKQNDAQGPQVALLAVDGLVVGLGRHVGGRAHIVENLGLLTVVFLAVAEVDDHWLPVPEHNIRRFQISVYEPLVPNSHVPSQQLHENEQRLVFLQSP